MCPTVVVKGEVSVDVKEIDSRGALKKAQPYLSLLPQRTVKMVVPQVGADLQ